MPHSGKDLGVDIWELWQAGKSDLPTVAHIFALSASHLAVAESSLDAMYRRGGDLGGGGTGRAYPDVAEMFEATHKLMKTMAERLGEIGETLCIAAKAYADTDDEARATFEEKQHSNPAPQQEPPYRTNKD